MCGKKKKKKKKSELLQRKGKGLFFFVRERERIVGVGKWFTWQEIQCNIKHKKMNSF